MSTMELSDKDKVLIEKKNITVNQLEEQLKRFKTGFGNLEVKSSASIDKGIKRLSEQEKVVFVNLWDEYLQNDKKIVKFVPASGAASRMFKDLYAFLSADYSTPSTEFEKIFFQHIEQFAFYGQLNAVCLKNYSSSIQDLIREQRYKDVVSGLLSKEGLNYGNLPKGLLSFHKYNDGVRTAMEEHLAEGAMYAKSKKGDVNIDFTVSPEHLDLFQQKVGEKKKEYENRFSVNINVAFSTQKESTDTIAVELNNELFRNADGNLVFRPGGHGALIENLNVVNADIVFIKNIDNVVPDTFKSMTVIYKKVLAGVLVMLQEKIFKYLNLIESGRYSTKQIEEMIYFLQDELNVKNPDMKYYEDAELVLYIQQKLNRPIRVCGMVINEGEPGGGPFFAFNPDRTISLQILESSQIDLTNPEEKKMLEEGTHFNPVDLVCGIKNFKGDSFNLPDYVDKDTGFISEKSFEGRTLKALELPGLWNGAMSDWNTVFVEVPAQTFNPVKTVNDLLRKEHQ